MQRRDGSLLHGSGIGDDSVERPEELDEGRSAHIDGEWLEAVQHGVGFLRIGDRPGEQL